MKKIFLLAMALVFMATTAQADATFGSQFERVELWKSQALDATGVRIDNWKPYSQIIENNYGVNWWRVDAMIMPETWNGETATVEWLPYHTKDMNPCGCHWRYRHWVETFFPASGPWWVAPEAYAEVISINGAPWCKIGRVMIPETWPDFGISTGYQEAPGYRRKVR